MLLREKKKKKKTNKQTNKDNDLHNTTQKPKYSTTRITQGTSFCELNSKLS